MVKGGVRGVGVVAGWGIAYHHSEMWNVRDGWLDEYREYSEGSGSGR